MRRILVIRRTFRLRLRPKLRDLRHLPAGLQLLGAIATYFLLTGQKISAQEALQLGVVSEVMPAADLLPRAWALAEQLLKQPPLTLRYARLVLTQRLKQQGVVVVREPHHAQDALDRLLRILEG